MSVALEWAREPVTEPDTFIPCTVLVALPRGWTSRMGSVFVRWGRSLLGLA